MILMFAFCAYLIFTTFTADQPDLAFSLFRQAWFGIPFLLIVSFAAVFLAFQSHEKQPKKTAGKK